MCLLIRQVTVVLVLTSPLCRWIWDVIDSQSKSACDLKGAVNNSAAAKNSEALAEDPLIDDRLIVLQAVSVLRIGFS